MELTAEIEKEIFQWDVGNWKKSLTLWNPALDRTEKLQCLEVGGRRGGLSLLAALKGHSAICSDLESPEVFAKPLHRKFKVENQIEYKGINVLQIPYKAHFDIVFLKSVLPSVGTYDRKDLQKAAIKEIYDSLKKGGTLLFAENLSGSRLHMFGRRHFVKWGGGVRYVSKEELLEFLSMFSSVEFKMIGFFGTFGRTEKQRVFLSKIDSALDRILPSGWKYLMVGIAKK